MAQIRFNDESWRFLLSWDGGGWFCVSLHSVESVIGGTLIFRRTKRRPWRVQEYNPYLNGEAEEEHASHSIDQ